MSTLVIPDTNVYLHFTMFTDVDWREIVGETAVTLVVLFPVLQELDRLKREPRLSKRARDVTLHIESLFTDGDTSTLRDGTPAMLAHAQSLATTLKANHLDERDGDERILAATLQLMNDGHEVILVTDDAGVRIRARSLGIRHCRMPDAHKRASADPLEAENSKLRRELDEIKLAMPKLELEFCEDGDRLAIVRTIPPPFREGLEDALLLSPLDINNLPMTYQFQPERPTRAEVDEYNRKLKALQPEYEEYLEARRVYEIFPFRVVPIELVLRNSGGKPAEKVKIALQMPEGVAILLEQDRPSKPTRPKRPELPGLRRGLRAKGQPDPRLLKTLADLLPYASPDSPGALVRAFLDASSSRDPLFHRGADDQGREVAEFQLGSISNFEDVKLDPFLLTFPSPEDVRSIGMEYSIRSHSLPRLVTGELHLIVKTEQ